ncbi:MAG: histidine kinase dimerization/phosphoacceptor domain -containing protein [Anaerolineae bacterium]
MDNPVSSLNRHERSPCAQGDHVENQPALDILQDSRHRIRPMALIHQTPYRSQNTKPAYPSPFPPPRKEQPLWPQPKS